MLEGITAYIGQDSRWSDVPGVYMCQKCRLNLPSEDVAVAHYILEHIGLKWFGQWVRCPLCTGLVHGSQALPHLIGCVHDHPVQIRLVNLPRPGATVSGG